MQRTINIEPHLIPRERGGWLALSAPERPVRIAVVGSTEATAREAFAAEIAAWDRLAAQLVDPTPRQAMG